MDAAEEGRLGGLVNGAALFRDLCCFTVKWKNAWRLQAEKNTVIGYGQFTAPLENWGFVATTTAELLFESGVPVLFILRVPVLVRSLVSTV